jgi:peptidoglycan/xylan/chitin deacetylase (PgdA/CDA1 family)
MPLAIPDWARNTAYRVLHTLSGPGDSVSVILLYHSIGNGTSQSLSRDAFESQLDLLAERFRFVRLDDLRRSLADPGDGQNRVSITFDDGFLDNFDQALPALERRRAPATFFIATGFLGGRFGTSAGELPMMAPAHLEEIAARGHEIGAHTVSHPKLTRISLDSAREEMRDSKAFLEDLLQKPVTSFAYPKGDYNAAVRDVARQVGFENAVTIEEGLVRSPPDWLALPRVWVSNRLSSGAFLAKLSPAVEWYWGLSRRLTRFTS